MPLHLLRFKDLRERGIVNNRPTLQRWIAIEGFPPGRMLGPNTRAWPEQEVDEWIESRPASLSGRDLSPLLRVERPVEVVAAGESLSKKKR